MKHLQIHKKYIAIVPALFIFFFCESMRAERVISYARTNTAVTLEIEWTARNDGQIQWERSTNEGQSWRDVGGATSPSYTFTITGTSFYRARIETQPECPPFYLEREVRVVNFSVATENITSNEAVFNLTNVDLKGATVVEHGFCFNYSDLNTRSYDAVYRETSYQPFPEGNAFSLTCTGLEPGTAHRVAVYFKTSDGSFIVGPFQTITTRPGIKWTSEDWHIAKNEMIAKFELPGFTSSMGNPSPVLKIEAGDYPAKTINITKSASGYFYTTDMITGLTPGKEYTISVEATISGEKQTIVKQVKTWSDYSKVSVETTTKPIENIIAWDATRTLHRISPEGLQTEYPRIIRVSNDTLLCAYHGGTNSDYWINIYLQKSYDNGQTWTAPVKLLDKESSTMGQRYWRFTNPEMTQLKNGRIVMSFTANGRPETNNNCHVMVMFSKDNGETWGDPIIVGRGRTWEPMIVQLPNDELELYVSSEAQWWGNTDPMPQEILFSRSTDHGLTWTSWKRAAYSPNRRDGMPAAVVMQGNKGIIFSIEVVNDGGYGSPSMVKRNLDGEWDATPWNGVNGNTRWKVPMNTHGGGPYTIQLPTGEIAVAAHVNGRSVWQTSYPCVMIDDSDGKNFLSTRYFPAGTPPSNEGVYYNSLFLKDNETVWLVTTHATFNGTQRIKGEIAYIEGKIVKR